MSDSHRVGSDRAFYIGMVTISGGYLCLILLMLLALASFSTFADFWQTLQREEVQFALRLSLITSTLSALLSVWVAVPVGYVLSRMTFRGKSFVEALLDIPVILPPLVIGLGLLILLQNPAGKAIEAGLRTVTKALFGTPIGITYEVPSIVLAQFMVACAFAVRTMKVTFDEINPRPEQVALTLGATVGQSFFRVTLPQAWRGMLAAGSLAWARSLGEFGPILVFSGATRMKTEVLPTTVFLELTVGNIEGAVAASLLMVIAAVAVLILVRGMGWRN